MLLIVYFVYGVYDWNIVSYIFSMFSSWFLVFLWLYVLFIFNFLGFEW